MVRRSLADDLNNLVTLASIHRGIGKVLGKQGKAAEGLESLERALRISEAIARRGSLPAYDLACTLALCSELAAAIPAGVKRDGPGGAALRRAVRR